MFYIGSVVWAREGGEGILANIEHSRLFRGCDYRDYKMIEWPLMYFVLCRVGRLINGKYLDILLKEINN